MFTETNFDWPTNRKNAYMLFYKKKNCLEKEKEDIGSILISEYLC